MYIFVEKINFINLIFFIFIRIFGIKIYFFSLSNILRKKKLIYLLNKINICFINFSEKNFYDDIPFGTITNLSRDILIQNVSNYCEKIDFSLLKDFFLSSDILKIFLLENTHIVLKIYFLLNFWLKNLELQNYLWINSNIDSEKFLPILIRKKFKTFFFKNI